MNKKSYIFGVVLILIYVFGVPIASSLSITINVIEKYTNIEAGERFYFEIGIKYPENPQRKDLSLEYEVKNIEGNLIAQSKVLKAVETQASFIDFIVIPENVEGGIYFINVKIKDYGELSEDVSASFNVLKKGKDKATLYFFILLFTLVFIGGVVVFLFLKLRKK